MSDERMGNMTNSADQMRTSIYRGFRYRLYPTPEQAEKLAQFAGVTRFVYNLALEQRSTSWRRKRFNFASQGPEVTALRAEVDWVAAVPADCLHRALRDLDTAFANFFAGRAGYPTPRKKGINDSFRIPGRETPIRSINRRWSMVKLPKIGLVRFRNTRPILGLIKHSTVTFDGAFWHVCLTCEIDHIAPANDNPAVGIDRGIAQTLSLSNGEVFQLPSAAELERQISRARRKLSRCQRGSIRRGKQKARLRKLTARAACIRRDWQHRASTDIASRFGSVTLEDLNIAGMTARGHGKRSLNRSIMAQGWGAFATMLAYKLEERGGTLIKVNPAYTSQTCSACGTVDKRSRESQASFVCTACGFRANADHNAAINILRRSTPAMLVEGGGYAPNEARTSRAAA